MPELISLCYESIKQPIFFLLWSSLAKYLNKRLGAMTCTDFKEIFETNCRIKGRVSAECFIPSFTPLSPSVIIDGNYLVFFCRTRERGNHKHIDVSTTFCPREDWWSFSHFISRTDQIVCFKSFSQQKSFPLNTLIFLSQNLLYLFMN